MSNIADDPSYWRARAREMRDLLETVSDEEMKELIEDIAERYEHLAEGIARQQANPKKH
jgi:hypothetical protein